MTRRLLLVRLRRLDLPSFVAIFTDVNIIVTETSNVRGVHDFVLQAFSSVMLSSLYGT